MYVGKTKPLISCAVTASSKLLLYSNIDNRVKYNINTIFTSSLNDSFLHMKGTESKNMSRDLFTVNQFIFTFLLSWSNLFFANCRNRLVYRNNVQYVLMDVFTAISFCEFLSLAQIAKKIAHQNKMLTKMNWFSVLQILIYFKQKF